MQRGNIFMNMSASWRTEFKINSRR